MSAKKKMFSQRIKYLIFLSTVCLLIVFFVFQNNVIGVSIQDYSNDKIPSAFDGYKIVQISDLHNKSFGKDNINLITKIIRENPDIIVITGDLLDSNRTDYQTALSFVRQASAYAPIYYVSGNHESYLPQSEYQQFINDISIYVTIMDDRSAIFEKDDDCINLVGLADPEMTNSILTEKQRVRDSSVLNLIQPDMLNILLSHRPELLSVYSAYGFDLVLSGHAHGGQFRLPFVGGIYAPNQGWFPTYSNGSYQSNNTEMIVSRGLGNSIIPIRIFNRPEIVTITLCTQ